MRANPAEYELVAPSSLRDALALMANNPGEWMPIAGGTDVMVLYAAGKLLGRKWVSVLSCPEMRGITVEAAEVRIGAACTYTDLRQHPVVAKEFSLLARSAAWTGGIANQNRGTLGGNIANASPAGDSLPVLLVYDADLILVSARGERRIPYRTFHTGYKKSLLGPDELIQTVCLRREFTNCTAYAKKVGARNAQAISKVFLAGVGRVADGQIESVRLAAGSVGPIPLRLYKTEAVLTSQVANDVTFENAKRILQQEVQPIDDIRSSARYRSVVLASLLREFFDSFGGSQDFVVSMNGILARWSQLSATTAAEEILPCCGSRAWARQMAAQRPFEDVATLLATSDRIWLELSAADWLEAFQSHPRIGETRSHLESSARSQQWSAQEQSLATESPDAVKYALAEGNREYERKFGRIFIICASGKSAAEILENLQRRLKNDDATELHEAAEQQRQIVQIRVKKWLTE